MNEETVDEAIDIYVSERMAKGKQTALAHFLACIYLKSRELDIVEMMRRVRGMTSYYMDEARVTRNPFKGPEVAWLGSLAVMTVYACVLISMEDQRNLGIALLSGALVNACYLIRCAAAKWCELNVLLAIYSEIVQIMDHELESLA